MFKFFKKDNNTLIIKDKPLEVIDFVKTNNYANKQLYYYFYIPETILNRSEKSFPLMILVSGLSGDGKSFVQDVFKNFAEEEKFIILSPSFMFDEKNWQIAKSYQYPEVWSGNALLKIIANMNKTGYKFTGYYLYGFSAGAQFVLRFTLWKPDVCICCSAHAGGGRIIPDKYVNTSYLVTAGDKDTHRLEHAEAFHYECQKLNIKSTLIKYNGGHSQFKEQIQNTIEFFKYFKNAL
ncbi:MAG: hypothetical protein AB1782_12110 [Cyanobacteriota bacterium]